MAEVKTVLVTNISAALDQTHLQELFGCCGPISKCKLEKLPDGEQICRITYTDPAHARAATVLNDTPLGDKKLRVTLDTPAVAAPVAAAAAPIIAAAPLLATPAVAPAPVLTMPPASSAPPDILAAVAAAAAAIPIPGTAPVPVPTGTGAPTDATPQISLPVYLPGTSTASTLMPTLPAHMLSQAQRRAEEIARTIYIGNLSPMVHEDALRKYFLGCGEILFTKIAGSNDQASRYGFIEFKELSGAQRALSLNGTQLGDRSIKVGKANNPIVKPSSMIQTADPETQEQRLSDAMRKVREAQERIARKVTQGSSGAGSGSGSEGRASSERGPDDSDRHGHRSRPSRNERFYRSSRFAVDFRRSRSRERERERERRSRRSRSRSRDRRRRSLSRGRRRSRSGDRRKQSRSRSKSNGRKRSVSRSRSRE